MNPLTQTRNQMKLNDRELELGIAGTKSSWHTEYKDSAWIFLGGLPYELTEGDVICMFSQYGEIVHINLIRDHTTGKSKGFGFLCYEDQRSTILAVDNLNGFKLLSKMIRVDHVHQYKLPKDLEKLDQDKKALFMSGVAPKMISEGESSSEEEEMLLEPEEEEEKRSKKKKKKEKKKHKKKKKKKDKGGGSDSEGSESSDQKHAKDNNKQKDKPVNGDSVVHRSRDKSPSERKRSPYRREREEKSRERNRGDKSGERREKRERSRSNERRQYDRKRSRSRERRRERS